jgi:hypothetical protein
METRPPEFPRMWQPTPPRVVELDRLGDELAELSAHLEAATARLLALIREFDARGGWNTGFRSCAEWLAWRVSLDLGAAPGSRAGRSPHSTASRLGHCPRNTHQQHPPRRTRMPDFCPHAGGDEVQKAHKKPRRDRSLRPPNSSTRGELRSPGRVRGDRTPPDRARPAPVERAPILLRRHGDRGGEPRGPLGSALRSNSCTGARWARRRAEGQVRTRQN